MDVEHDRDGPRHWSDWVREDVGDVRPLGSYAAKRCPVRTQLDVLRPVEPAPTPEFLAMLGRRGDEFEQDVVADLAATMSVCDVSGDSREDRKRVTTEAMARGEAVIVGGRLPVDPAGRRAGEPDLLVRAGDRPFDATWRYAPVDIKSHRILTDPGAGTAVVVQDPASLSVPVGTGEEVPSGRTNGSARADTLQLAHYHRMLAAAGHGLVGAAWGGIVGAEGAVAWYRLDVARWGTPTADPEQRRKLRTSLEVYDFEFGFRLDIAAVATRHAADPSVPLLVEPVCCPECGNCPWRNHCLPQLEERRDLSLLPRVGFTVWRALRDAGIATIEQLAATPDEVEVDALGGLDELRLQARARLQSSPVPRSSGAGAPRVPVADVEIDVDMENDADGAYLWGAHVTNRAAVEVVEPGYHAFANWEPAFGEEERAEVFLRFWHWLLDVRQACQQRGLTFAAFCWYEAAENRYLRDGAALTGLEDEVEDFIASDDWIDLHRWFASNYATGRGNGLKTVATQLGFAWRDEEPGGGLSMVWRAAAIDPSADVAQRETARERLLAYNEDDVLATLAVRESLAVLRPVDR